MNARYTRDSIDPKMYEALKAEGLRIASEEYDKVQAKQLMWMWAITLMTLHDVWGFGRERLQRTFDAMVADYDRAIDRYGLNQKPTALNKAARERQKKNMMSYGELCVIKLREMGLDVRAMFEAAEKE